MFSTYHYHKYLFLLSSRLPYLLAVQPSVTCVSWALPNLSAKSSPECIRELLPGGVPPLCSCPVTCHQHHLITLLLCWWPPSFQASWVCLKWGCLCHPLPWILLIELLFQFILSSHLPWFHLLLFQPKGFPFSEGGNWTGGRQKCLGFPPVGTDFSRTTSKLHSFFSDKRSCN